MRTYDLDKVTKATSQYSESIEGFNPEEWLGYEGNVALVNDNNDIALFEEQSEMEEGTVCGHYFFWSRGKKAVEAAEQFLQEIFSDDYNVETILGLTPVENKGAIWMNKRLGFNQYGLVHTVVGPCQFVILTKQQWKDSK